MSWTSTSKGHDVTVTTDVTPPAQHDSRRHDEEARSHGKGAKLTAADIEEIAERHRNWGRWGDDDQLGTVNFIDEACVRRAASLVRRGTVISCGLPYDEHGPQTGGFGRVNPIHVMMEDGASASVGTQDHLRGLRYADDAIYMPLQCGTQWDALSHVFYGGVMYGGRPQDLVTSKGAPVNGIEQLAEKIVTRGILLDIPATAGSTGWNQARRSAPTIWLTAPRRPASRRHVGTSSSSVPVWSPWSGPPVHGALTPGAMRQASICPPPNGSATTRSPA